MSGRINHYRDCHGERYVVHINIDREEPGGLPRWLKRLFGWKPKRPTLQEYVGTFPNYLAARQAYLQAMLAANGRTDRAPAPIDNS